MKFDEARRRILEGIALLLGLGVVVENAKCHPKQSADASKEARVALARRAGVVDSKSGVIDQGKLRDLLEKSICAATGAQSARAACARLFSPHDVVGIKVNTLAGPGLSTHPEIVAQMVTWLLTAGIRPGNIVVWDRSDRELVAAGYTLNRDGSRVRYQGTNDDYDWTPREWGGGGSCFARLLVSEITALINVGMLKDHDLSGISAGLKNLYGVIHNPNKYHDSGCSPYLAQLAAHPLIKDKLRLTILDGLVAQCHGGPARNPRWAWPYEGVLVSTDPVAIDAIAYRIIEARRREIGLPPLAQDGRAPQWIVAAEELGLGIARPEHIRLVEV